MQISAVQLNDNDLSAFGREAAALLLAGDFDALAAKFGYALAYGREPSVAIKEELEASLVQLGATSLDSSARVATSIVKYFKPNDARLLALVECFIATSNGSQVLLELTVAGIKQAAHITLEEISAAA